MVRNYHRKIPAGKFTKPYFKNLSWDINQMVVQDGNIKRILNSPTQKNILVHLHREQILLRKKWGLLRSFCTTERERETVLGSQESCPGSVVESSIQVLWLTSEVATAYSWPQHPEPISLTGNQGTTIHALGHSTRSQL